MSKIGETPVRVPEGTQIQIKDGHVTVTGKEGSVELDVPASIDVVQENTHLILTRKSDSKRNKGLHGLYRSLINNAVQGVNKKWQKCLEVVGTGYRVKQKGNGLEFELGYSHPVVYDVVDGIEFGVEGKNKVVVQGVDKQLVGEVAHKIRLLRKPDAYKGKGVRYEGEQIKLKPGKKAKTATAA